MLQLHKFGWFREHEVQRKGQIQITTMAGRERIKIEKDNSHSSLQSHLQSSSSVSMQGSYLSNHEAEAEIVVEYNDSLHQHLVVDDENHGSSGDHDPLDEAIFTLQSAQEVLEKELFKFKVINKGVSGDDSISDLHAEFVEADQGIQQTCSQWMPYSGSVNGYTETELEDLFMQKIETEVVYLVTSRMVEDLRFANVKRITALKEQRAVASEHTQMVDTLRDIEKEAAMLKKELESGLDKIAVADETIELQNRVCKYGLCFLLQIVCLIVIVVVFMFRMLRNYKEATVPT